MHVKELRLTGFRNYQNETFTFCPGTNIIYGKNAQGKTNVLEAIYLFSIGKSFRTQQERELIHFSEQIAKVEIIYDDSKRENKIEFAVRRDKKKQIKINGVPIQKMGELIGCFTVVLFSPDELNLTKGSPNARRRFLDIAASQMYPKYYHILKRYYKVLYQSNNLIKKLRHNRSEELKDTLSVWDEKLIDYGMMVVSYRKQLVEALMLHAKKIHREISGEDLLLDYKTSFSTKEEFAEKLRGAFEREIEMGFTLYGPHKDDLEILVAGKDIKTYGSQGQHRSAVLALKFAQADFMCESTGEYPVLLLDDIMSELDSYRRSYLAEKIKEKQVIITCTDADNLSQRVDAKINLVQNGKIMEKEG